MLFISGHLATALPNEDNRWPQDCQHCSQGFHLELNASHGFSVTPPFSQISGPCTSSRNFSCSPQLQDRPGGREHMRQALTRVHTNTQESIRHNTFLCAALLMLRNAQEVHSKPALTLPSLHSANMLGSTSSDSALPPKSLHTERKLNQAGTGNGHSLRP